MRARCAGPLPPTRICESVRQELVNCDWAHLGQLEIITGKSITNGLPEASSARTVNTYVISMCRAALSVVDVWCDGTVIESSALCCMPEYSVAFTGTFCSFTLPVFTCGAAFLPTVFGPARNTVVSRRENSNPRRTTICGLSDLTTAMTATRSPGP